jgi:hypothetical protein
LKFDLKSNNFLFGENKMKNLNDDQLLQSLQYFVKKERALIAQLLSYLEEVEKRKLHLERGFSSMFAFCTDYLGYTPHEAQMRIQAMRLSRKLPEVRGQIQSGEISLTVASKVYGHVAREIKELKENNLPTLAPEKIKYVVEEVKSLSVKQAEKVLLEIFPNQSALPPEKTKLFNREIVRVEMNLHEETLAKLEKIQAIRSHCYGGKRDFDLVIRDLCELGLKKWDLAKKWEERQKRSFLRTTVRH